MIIRKLAVGFKLAIPIIMTAMALLPNTVQADGHFHIEKNPQGLILPFKAVSVPLPEFVREYARATSTPIATGGIWEEDLKGTVTLFLRHPLNRVGLTEVFHRAIGDNGYSVVDAPAGNGWLIVRTRDARDLALPVFESTQVSDSGRLVTAYHDLRYVDAESVARVMRSFMPANSRIIPTTRSQVFMTDTASNILKVNLILSKMDTEEGAKRQRDSTSWVSQPRSCGEQRIEKLVIENLEIQESNGQNPQMKNIKERIKK